MTNIIKKDIQRYDLSRPTQIVQMARVLKEYIIKNDLSVKIVNKDYVMVEGWQFAGWLTGNLPTIESVQDLGSGKWMAKAEIINQKTGKVVSRGFAICTKAESKKSSFDEYAVLSMAQTRAIGKAYRNFMGWMIKLAGYEATPAEEIKGKPAEEKKTGTSAGGLMAGDNEKERIKILAKALGLNTVAKIETATGLKVDMASMTKDQASRVYAELLQIKLAKK